VIPLPRYEFDIDGMGIDSATNYSQVEAFHGTRKDGRPYKGKMKVSQRQYKLKLP